MSTVQLINRKRDSSLNSGMLFWMVIFAALAYHIRNVGINMELLAIRTNINHEQNKATLEHEVEEIEKFKLQFRNLEDRISDLKIVLANQEKALNRVFDKLGDTVVSKEIFHIISEKLDKQRIETANALKIIGEKAQEQTCHKFCISKFTSN